MKKLLLALGMTGMLFGCKKEDKNQTIECSINATIKGEEMALKEVFYFEDGKLVKVVVKSEGEEDQTITSEDEDFIKMEEKFNATSGNDYAKRLEEVLLPTVSVVDGTVSCKLV